MSEKRMMSEDEAYTIALNDHPQWRQQLEDETLPDEIMGDDGEPMSPRMHLTIHAIVERQLSADEPEGVVEIAEQLEQLNFSRHEIRHEIGRAVVNQMWCMQKEGCEFDEGRYLAELKEIVEGHRHGDT